MTTGDWEQGGGEFGIIYLVPHGLFTKALPKALQDAVTYMVGALSMHNAYVYKLVLIKCQDLGTCVTALPAQLPGLWEQGGGELGVFLVLIHQGSPKGTPGMTCCHL